METLKREKVVVVVVVVMVMAFFPFGSGHELLLQAVM